jgi:peptidoglycan/LPS O-acetylase OafA/YrhL
MAMNQVPRARPAGVTAVAALFLLYGIGMVVNAAQNQGWTGWVEAGSLPRALLRLAGAGLVAWGVFQGAAWAWWVGLALAVLWLAGGLVPVVVMERGDLQWLEPSSDQIVLAVALLSLALAITLLLTRPVRGFFRRP